MPSNADDVRIVIDETSFDFRGLPASDVESHLTTFSNALADIRRIGLAAWKPPLFAEAECGDESDLYSYVLTNIDPDVMRRFFSLLDKCPEWDAGYPLCDEVELDGRPRQSAWSICFAVTAASLRSGVACMVFPAFARRGFVHAVTSIGSYQIYFFAAAADLHTFWRDLFELEDIPEERFFDLAAHAFPNLIFHPDLSFRRFSGAYSDRRAKVVQHLSELNDHFWEAYRAALASGRMSDIEARFGARGIAGISRESVKTHKNSRAMSYREVLFEGQVVYCEWHSKLEPNIDRIHFAFGEAFGDKILIGIFADHLPL